jgi:hypothetical protein
MPPGDEAAKTVRQGFETQGFETRSFKRKGLKPGASKLMQELI